MVYTALKKREYSRCTSPVPGGTTSGSFEFGVVLIGISKSDVLFDASKVSVSRAPTFEMVRRN